MLKLKKANKLAADPDTVSLENLVPNFFASSVSKFFANRPAVSHISSEASIRLAQSASSKTLPDAGIYVLPGIKVCFKNSN